MSQIIVPVRGKAASKTKMKMKKKKVKPVTEKELTKLGAMFRYLGATAGGAAGGIIGYPLHGAAVGTSLGAALSKWLGSGDYTLSKNSLALGTNVPMMHKDGQSIIVRHREFVGEIKGSTAFTVQNSVVLNPGLSSSFPWLATVAGAYSEYRIRGMVFHYVPTSGASVASTNTALGTVMFQTTYRSSDVAPSSKLEMLNEYCSNETIPSCELAHPIECAPKENPFQIQYVRGGAVPAGDSSLLYDLGTTYIATSGMPANGNTIGDVWMSYEIELKKPVVSSNVSNLDDSTATFTIVSSSQIFSNIVSYPAGIVGDPTNAKLYIPTQIGKSYNLIVGLYIGFNTNGTFLWAAPTISGGSFVSLHGIPSTDPINFTGTQPAYGGAVTNRVSFTATANQVILSYPSYNATNVASTVGPHYVYLMTVDA